MVKLIFKFDKNELEKTGHTEEKLLQPMREHARKYNINENEIGVFSKNGQDALSVMTMAVPMIIDIFPDYINLLSEWTLDIDGEKENCIQEIREWSIEHNKD